LMMGARIKVVFYGLMVLSGVSGSAASFLAFSQALTL